MNLFLVLKKTDKILLAAVFFLTLIGVLELAGMAQNGQITTAQLGKQIASFGIGLALMFGAALIDYRFFKNNSYKNNRRFTSNEYAFPCWSNHVLYDCR